jgi:hypothetical protein
MLTWQRCVCVCACAQWPSLEPPGAAGAVAERADATPEPEAAAAAAAAVPAPPAARSAAYKRAPRDWSALEKELEAEEKATALEGMRHTHATYVAHARQMAALIPSFLISHPPNTHTHTHTHTHTRTPPCRAGDAALNKLFRELYAGADDDTRRAMVKSYTESGGTCLSTDWRSVGAKAVPVEPPEGLVAKKYEQ